MNTTELRNLTSKVHQAYGGRTRPRDEQVVILCEEVFELLDLVKDLTAELVEYHSLPPLDEE